VKFEPSLPVTHHTPLHRRAVPAALRMMTRHALMSFSLKHWSRGESWLLGGVMKIESAVRQAVAWATGRRADASFHAQTRLVIRDLLAGRPAEARRRVDAIADSLVEAAAAQDRRSC
jgi:hypothetical protein